jgi:hypothetical protein
MKSNPISAFDAIKLIDLSGMPKTPDQSNPNTPKYTPIQDKKKNHGGSIEKTKPIDQCDGNVNSLASLKPVRVLEGGSKILDKGRTSDMGDKRWTIDAYPRSEKKNTPKI